ncbi:plasmid pRiA4b ORF-3 family protein [Amycolatopsis sp. NPDC021455]|uniref:plasmid pRiA4b ORF-3 family protein n=1 Tax=Amycolatopsis sp. NPDC021455 TaxID=3154901 RepID=UPI0033CECF51
MNMFDVTKPAQDCAAFIEIRRIAEWVGDGKPVTSKGVLRPADLRRASAETGIPVPERFRSAGDIPHWNRLWTAALAVGAISLEGGVVKAGPPMEVTPSLWLRALAAALSANFEDEDPVEALADGHAALTALAAGEPARSRALPVEILIEFGAVTKRRQLTDLGRWALGELARGATVSADPHVEPGRICQLKVTLTGMGSWRRVLIHSDATLGDLHRVIQVVMRWDDEHLHGFTVGNRQYGSPGYDMNDEEEITVGEAFTRTRKRLGYTYDFGDDWRHDIELEQVLDVDPSLTYPVCVAGRGEVPVEDTQFRVIRFDQDDINRRLSGAVAEPEESPFDAVIETVVTHGWYEDEVEAFAEALETELDLPAEAIANGEPVKVLEFGRGDWLRPPFAVCRRASENIELDLADIRFPPETAAAWLHAAYRHYLGLEPFPAEPHPDWSWPES